MVTWDVVKEGAAADGIADDAVVLRSIFEKAAMLAKQKKPKGQPPDEVYLPAGVYRLASLGPQLPSLKYRPLLHIGWNDAKVRLDPQARLVVDLPSLEAPADPEKAPNWNVPVIAITADRVELSGGQIIGPGDDDVCWWDDESSGVRTGHFLFGVSLPQHTTHHVTISDTAISGMAFDGVMVRAGDHIQVKHVSIAQCGRTGVAVTNGHCVEITECNILGCGQGPWFAQKSMAGIHAEPAGTEIVRGLTVTRCVTAAGNIGMRFGHGKGGVLENVVARDNTSWGNRLGVFVERCESWQLIDNVAIGNGTGLASWSSEARHGEIVDNVAIRNTEYGVSVGRGANEPKTPQYIRVQGNRCRGTRREEADATSVVDDESGIKVGNPVAVEVRHNISVDNGTHGIVAAANPPFPNCEVEITKNRSIGNGVEGNMGSGVWLTKLAAATVEHNVLTGNGRYGLEASYCDAIHEANNDLSNNLLGEKHGV